MPIFDFNDFNYRNVLKLAPDAFVTFNGSMGARIVSPLKESKWREMSFQGGITSINVSSATQTASGRATIQVVAPVYKGIHEDYYVTLPSGARLPYFLPLMEVKIYMKSRFTKYTQNTPVYYPVFWGLVTNISEDYNDGVTTFSLSCADILTWWKYQKITVNPSVFTSVFGGPKIENFPTIFKNKNPWQIIMALIYDTGWKSRDNNTTYNMVYQSLSNTKLPPDIGNLPLSTIGALANKINTYWSNRFSLSGENVDLEMFGVTGQISTKSLNTLKYMTLRGVDLSSTKYNEEAPAELKLDYNLLARVQPFGDINLFGDGASSVEMTKLEIANKVCEMTHMEFFLDTSGALIFKPPFYNMDITRADVPYYVIEPSDVISFNSSLNTDEICTYLELSAPKSQTIPELDVIGFHIDFDLLARYGMRHQRAFIQYGNDAKTLRLICAAEMARINGQATTGSVSIPLRPELRLGYPVYIVHKDEYYYVSGITHSFSYGSGATTDLSLEMKRERIYDSTGEITSKAKISYETTDASVESNSNIGRILKGYVWRFRNVDNLEADDIFSDKGQSSSRERALEMTNLSDSAYATVLSEKEKYKRATGSLAGPEFNGLYEISPARLSGLSTVQSSPLIVESGEKATIVSNELVMITNDTIPYTDAQGYRHIGAFPYGANLRLINGVDIVDESILSSKFNDSIRQMIKEDGELLPSEKKPVVPFQSAPESFDAEDQKFNDSIYDIIIDQSDVGLS